MHYHYLEIIKGLDTGKRYLLKEGTSSIGRDLSHAIVISAKEKAVSVHHAIMYKASDTIIIQDLQSTNGIYINEQKVTEKQIDPGDVVGFGKTGPRMKLIVADTLLSSDSQNRQDAEDCSINETTATVKRSRRPVSIFPSRFYNSYNNPQEPCVGNVREKISLTADLENKLLLNKADTDDIRIMMKNESRIKKIIRRGKIHNAQAHLLLSVFNAGLRTKMQWTLTVIIICILFTAMSSFLLYRTIQYKNMVKTGLSLENTLDAYEQKIFQSNADPDKNKEELKYLIDEFELKKSEFIAVKKNIQAKDFHTFYTDSTELIIDGIMKRLGESDYHIPPQMTQRVKYHLCLYSGRLKPRIAQILGRKQHYFPMIKTIFQKKNLPEDLAYVAMLESGLNPQALSHAGARGLWQFIPSTARQYHLNVNDRIDERTNPEKATRAAAEYFEDLISIFGAKGSVMLAMAAYNAGENRIIRALKKIDDPVRNRDFWYIYRLGILSEETNEYIPRIIALMIIDQYRHRYGFDDSEDG